MDCIFCQIAGGNMPSEKIYEDDDTIAFLDIAPCNPGHSLIIAKKHYENIESTPIDLLCKIITTVKKVGTAVKDGLGVEGYNISVNNDPIAGRIVPHLHFHIIPRIAGDGHKLWTQGRYAEGEARIVADKIKAKI